MSKSRRSQLGLARRSQTSQQAAGNGFKAGGYVSLRPSRLPKPIPRHVVRACVAVYNKSSVVCANHHVGGGDWLGNSAYRNGTNFNMLYRKSDNVTDVPAYGQVLRVNISYGKLLILALARQPTPEENSSVLALMIQEQAGRGTDYVETKASIG